MKKKDMVTREQVIEMLQSIIDPEVNLDIYTMGLIYDIQIKSETDIFILMTLTTPACPVGPFIQSEVKSAMQDLGFTSIDVELTFDPPWQAPQALREALGV